MDETTVSGNDLPEKEVPDSQDGKENETNKTASPETDTPDPEEAASSVQASYSYVYEADNEEVCSLLRSILDETVRRNDILSHISDNTDTVLQIITPEDAAVLLSETEAAEELPADDYKESAIKLLENIDVSLSSINDSSQDMSSTVSGNSVYLEDIDNTLSGFTETYAETSSGEQHIQHYGLSIQLGMLFACSCIFGILISRCVFGKMR